MNHQIFRNFCFKMSLSVFMDPLDWSYRYYLIQSIQKCGFENGWEPIISHVNILTTTFLKKEFNVSPKQCHLFYLQLLAEFGDFRYYSDPLTLPSPEIIQKVTEMRQSQLRHELLLANNKIRYNNFILKHHNQEPVVPNFKMPWLRCKKEENQDLINPNELVSIVISAKDQDWYNTYFDSKSEFYVDAKGKYGKVDCSIDNILSRCVSGLITTPFELMRDIQNLVVNLSFDENPNVIVAVHQMEQFFFEKLTPLLQDNPKWNRLLPLFEETQ